MALLRKFLALVFGFVVCMRNKAYDLKFFRSRGPVVPVVSVGNISVGGTGKTPLVEFLCERFLAEKQNVAMVTRGYKRRTKGTVVVSDGQGFVTSFQSGGDEAVQVSRKLPQLVVIADEKRVRGCAKAVQDFHSGIIVLDDGFQHRACRRDCDIVVIDTSRGLETELLPAGRLREPLANLSRADIIIMSKCGSPLDGKYMYGALQSYTSAPFFSASFLPARLKRTQDDSVYPADALSGIPVLAFCGIGTPGSFRATLEGMGMDVRILKEFPDHHAYSEDDITSLLAEALNHRVSAIVTTEKDTVRLQSFAGLFRELPLYYPVMRMDFFGDEEELMEEIHRCLAGFAQA